MRFSPSGDYLLAAGEEVTITVVSQNGPQLAAFPDAPSCGPWTSKTDTPPDRTVAVFKAPPVVNATCAVVITYLFTPGPQPTDPTSPSAYQVNVQGKPEEFSDPHTVTSPFAQKQVPYLFLVDRL